MSVIVIGSHAALLHGIIPERKPKDYDIIGDREGALKFAQSIGTITGIQESETGVIYFTDVCPIEVELIDNNLHSLQLFEAMRPTARSGFASPEWLYFLKMSHRYKKDSPHFRKTMQDIFRMRKWGITLPEGSEGLMKDRELLTYRNQLPKLNVKKDDFFKKEDTFYKYDHDSIHEAVALGNSPAYTHYLKDGSEVLTSRKKFFSVPEAVRLLGGLEEALVLTAERSLIPNDFKPNPDRMFLYALEKVCTSITGGYFREYCYDNFHNIASIYGSHCRGSWSQELKEKLDNGEVKLYNTGTVN